MKMYRAWNYDDIGNVENYMYMYMYTQMLC